MSDAMRNYSPSRRAVHGAPVSGSRVIRRAVLILLIAGAVWAFWTTRDTWPMERLVPRDQAFHLRGEQVLASRQRAADSPVWDIALLPAQYRDIPGWLRSDFGLPEWVLNNLVSDVCYVSGKDVGAFSDLLVVTRMSRIGCLLERYHRFVEGIDDEYAGGLHLRKMSTIDGYYAVRGRTLVFSPSRSALIEALTLRESDALETLEDTIPVAGGDIQGRVLISEDDPLGRYIEQVEFGFSFAPTAIHLSSQSVVRPEWRAQLEAMALGSAPQSLSVPARGSVVLAGDLDTPLPDVWDAFEAFSGGGLSACVGPWLALAAPDTEGEGEEPLAFLKALQSSLGSAFALQIGSFDARGIVPLPEVALYLETVTGVGTLLDAIPALETGATPADWRPVVEPESGIIKYPIGWGSIVEPALLRSGQGVQVALHPEHLRHSAGGDVAGGSTTTESGHLFLRVRPGEALELLREGGLVYAGAGLIPDHTRESFDEAIAQALAGARQVKEVRGSAEYTAGAVRVDIVVELEAGTGAAT